VQKLKEDMPRKLIKAKSLRAMEGGECPVCELIKEKENGFLEDILMELVDDAKFRNKLMESGGFCLKHFNKLILLAGRRPDLNGVGISDILRDLIQVEIRELQKMDKELNRIRSEQPLPMDEEFNILTKVIRRLFGRA
jgi:hypothetical protein